MLCRETIPTPSKTQKVSSLVRLAENTSYRLATQITNKPWNAVWFPRFFLVIGKNNFFFNSIVSDNVWNPCHDKMLCCTLTVNPHALIKSSQFIKFSTHFGYILLKQSFDISYISNIERFIKGDFDILRLQVKWTWKLSN